MTNEELAQHWNMSLSEVQNISDFMNKNYYLCVGKNKNDGLFYGLMYKIDEKHGPMLSVSSKQGYKTAKEAAVMFNEAFDNIEMSEIRAELMGVPVDAYKALKKIDISSLSTNEKNYNLYKGRGARD